MQLIVNADDFGLCSGVNQGIIQAHRQGIVTSTTVMVNLVAGAEVVELVQTNPQLGVGIHLNTTCGRPLSEQHQVTSIIDTQGRFKRPEYMQKADPREVESEWRAQIQRFLSWGLKPSHLDSHHHIHTLPQLWPMAIGLAKELGVPIRHRYSNLRTEAAGAGLITSTDFVENFYGDQATVEDLTKIINQMNPGVTELMCHPAVICPDLPRISSYVEARLVELQTLTSSAIKDLVNSKGIQLINYRQMLGSSKG